jgi:hypothetical protein
MLLALVAAVTAPAARADEAPAKDAAADANLQTFGIGPANRDGLDRRQAFVYAGRPGTVIRDQVALLNYTFKPLKVRVYAGDAFTADGGAFDVVPAAAKSTDLGAWTSLKPRVVTLPARSSAQGSPPSQTVVPFRIKVPAKATPGDHAAGIVASTRTDEVSGNTTGIVVDRRVGTRIYLRVAGALDPRLEVKDLAANYVGTLNPFGRGRVEVSYRVENTGNVALSATQRVRVEGAFGTSSASAPLDDVVQILPGDDVAVSTVVEGVWPTLRVTAVVDVEPYAGEGDAKEQFAAVSATAGLWAIPWTLLALLIAITFGVAYALRRRRNHPVTPDEKAIEEEAVLVP